MTPEEKALYRSDDFESKMMSAPVTKTRIGADGKPYRYTGPVEQGIKITVKSKAESDAMNESVAAAQQSQQEKEDVTMTEETKKE